MNNKSNYLFLQALSYIYSAKMELEEVPNFQKLDNFAQASLNSIFGKLNEVDKEIKELYKNLGGIIK